MSDLFEPTSINGMALKNRFIRSGTWTGMATEDGFMTPKLEDLIVNVAGGGAALIVPDYAPVLKNGRSASGQLGAYDDAQIPGLAALVDAVHAAGAKIMLQLVHGGAHSRPELTGVEAMGPSAMSPTPGKMGGFPGCREMTRSDIDDVVEAYRLAAIRAVKAGFDAVQVHCAHGYLFSQFLSPFYNKRTDEYGGSVANRARIVVDAYHQVRKEVGNDYPVMVKMNATDLMEGGISFEDAIEAAAIYATMGINAIELSGGTGWALRVLGDFDRTCMRIVKEEGYYRDAAIRLKAALAVPVILTGGVRKYETAERFLNDGVANYIGLCRPLIREPGLINRWESGDMRESECISDNGCAMAAASGKDLRCTKLAQQQ